VLEDVQRRRELSLCSAREWRGPGHLRLLPGIRQRLPGARHRPLLRRAPGRPTGCDHQRRLHGVPGLRPQYRHGHLDHFGHDLGPGAAGNLVQLGRQPAICLPGHSVDGELPGRVRIRRLVGHPGRRASGRVHCVDGRHERRRLPIRCGAHGRWLPLARPETRWQSERDEIPAWHGAAVCRGQRSRESGHGLFLARARNASGVGAERLRGGHGGVRDPHRQIHHDPAQHPRPAPNESPYRFRDVGLDLGPGRQPDGGQGIDQSVLDCRQHAAARHGALWRPLHRIGPQRRAGTVVGRPARHVRAAVAGGRRWQWDRGDRCRPGGSHPRCRRGDAVPVPGNSEQPEAVPRLADRSAQLLHGVLYLGIRPTEARLPDQR
jgi:hypothetical protein